ncbi:LysR family transcriptional regulator [Motilimonas pumila]|uniref:LysR family transcriptional regulator n=1 Tax=Motilimonas pumila TaxID=2303987 RepID=A0A418YHQ3_9GAMM|nr:LysR family transcriptional regulator [Motilimonas pumila]RJG49892.1 LysR family transcriptional regulator [Motilimonas pumila]
MPKSTHFDLNLLRVFLSVYKTGSYSATAEQLDLTPSAVSHAIKRLNAELKEVLFQRKSAGVEPTFVAHDFYKQVSPGFAEIERSILGYEKFCPTDANRTFRVFVPDVFIANMITRLEQINTSNSQIICVALPLEQDVIYQALTTGEVDLVVDYISPGLGGIESKLVVHEAVCCVANAKHPRINKAVSYQQYFEEVHAKLNLHRFDSRAAETLAIAALPERKTHSEHNSLYSMLFTVANSEAIGICPERLAQEFSNQLPLRIMPVPFEARQIEVWVNWPKKLATNPANRWLRDIIMASLQR